MISLDSTAFLRLPQAVDVAVFSGYDSAGGDVEGGFGGAAGLEELPIGLANGADTIPWNLCLRQPILLKIPFL